MNIMRWEPFDDPGTLRRSMDQLVDEFFTGRRPASGLAVREGWTPSVEMFETDAAVVVRAALPNIDPKQVDITVTNDSVTLRGETKQEEEHKARNYYRREFRHGTFARTLPLATEVKSAEAKAVYKDGVLEVTLPKSDRGKPTSVKVQVG